MSDFLKISAMVPQDAADRLKATSEELKKSQSELIRQALELYLKNLENQKTWLTLLPTK